MQPRNRSRTRLALLNHAELTVDKLIIEEAELMMRISANVTADFGNVTDSAGLGVARC